MRRSHSRAMMISLFVIIISVFNFQRLTNSDCIRAIHVITLLVIGAAIGVFLSNFFALIIQRKRQQ
ncbi:MAG TPA: hypothetical protein VN722_11200 [Hanamia sp.]|nr:hypothetical protein [Hanamia sp.]